MLLGEVSESYTNTDFLELDSSSVHGWYLQRKKIKCIIKGKKNIQWSHLEPQQVKDALRNMHCGLSLKLLNLTHPNGNLKILFWDFTARFCQNIWLFLK